MKYSLGLDIGVTSVGWAIIDLEKQRIHDLGVRIFERAEDPQSGESLSKPRRDARSARRRLHRRRQRLNFVKHFFIQKNLLLEKQVDELFEDRRISNAIDPYELRVKALDKKLSHEELFRAVYHLAKHRGYKSNRKLEANEGKSTETGRVLLALSENEKLLAKRGYRTVAEALVKDEKYKGHKRNKRDDYTNSFGRQDYIDELQAILEKQREFGLKISDNDVKYLVYGVTGDGEVNVNAIMYQRPFMTKELMQKMIGNCTFEPNEKRAPRASYSFEVFRMAGDLAHVVLVPKAGQKLEQKSITLTPEAIQTIIEAAKRQGKITYKKVRQLAGVSDAYMFNTVRGKISDDDPYGEKNEFGHLKAYHDIKKALKNMPDSWDRIKDDAQVLDAIALAFTINKVDQEIKADLDKTALTEDAKNALLLIKDTNFKAFGHLSTKALQKITPNIMSGNTYDKACELAGYDFRKKGVNLEQITNPVVKRAISQTIKVVKAVEKKYGKPYFIKVETSRELAKNFRDRQQIDRENKENQARNQQIIVKIKEYGITAPTGQQIIKFKLYNEQNAKSLYSGKPIDVVSLLSDDNAYQVDHIIPFSRSGNDGLTNKALVTTEENQLKGNKTPYEAFGADETAWNNFVALVEATYKTRLVNGGNSNERRENYKYNGYAFKKKANLLTKDYQKTEWNARALNDTRYISRFITSYLNRTIEFAEGPEKQRVIAPNGTLTAYMRKRWGLSKDRDQDVLHHAKDAAVVAAVSQDMIQQVNIAARAGEIQRFLQNANTLQEKVDLLTGEVLEDDIEYAKASKAYATHILQSGSKFPTPWPRFAEEVDWRTRVISAEDLRDKCTSFDTYDNEFINALRPIFVSRMPHRKATAKAHKETLRSKRVDENDMRTVRMPIMNVKLSDLENSPVKDSDPQLYETLKSRLQSHGDNPAKAFIEPVYKKDKRGRNAHMVRAIKIASKQPSGFYVNKGRAFVNNGSMVRLDVYKKPNQRGAVEHFFVPVYAHQISGEKHGQRVTKIMPAPRGFTDVDDSFEKVASLYPNDYVQIVFTDRVVEGYYVQYNINNGSMQIMGHAMAGKGNENLLQVSARSAASIRRYDISILGGDGPDG